MPMYRHYHVQWMENDKGQSRWCIDDLLDAPDERGKEGFETREEAFDYVDKLMKESGREHEGLTWIPAHRKERLNIK